MGDPKTNRVEFNSHLRWVSLEELVVNPKTQRELNVGKVNSIGANLDLDQIGYLVVSSRNDKHFILDGQHRTEVLKRFFADDLSIKVQCRVYEDLTEEQEAEMFLKLNDQLHVTALAKFKVGVTAGRAEESDIDRIIRSNGAVVAKTGENSISCVGTLRTVYRRNGGPALGRAVRLILAGAGEAGLTAQMIDGMGMVVGTYNGALDDRHMVKRLGETHGGVAGVMNGANQTRLSTGHPMAQCVAAQIVDVYNKGKQGRSRLPQWWSKTNRNRALAS
jgi:hypothetical protein